MTVIAELRVAAHEFELGRILSSAPQPAIELQTLVPMGERPVPFFAVREEVRESFETDVREHPSVNRIQVVEDHDGRVVYALDWDTSADVLFNTIEDTGASLVSGRGGDDAWAFEIRFPSHGALSEFNDLCSDADLDLTVDRVYNPSDPEAGAWYGLTRPQRETLMRAVEGGYYSIPRRMSTSDLAREFGVSDQAITERLRRAIVALVEHTLMVAQTEEQ